MLKFLFTSSTNDPALSNKRFNHYRDVKNLFTTWGMGIGGISVIIAILLIFLYLLLVVLPLFLPAKMTSTTQFAIPEPTAGKTVLLTSEEQNKVAVRFTSQGKAVFFAVEDGKTIKVENLLENNKSQVTSFNNARLDSAMIAYGLSNGRVQIAKHEYHISYPNDQIHVGPMLSYPFGRNSFVLDQKHMPIKHVAFASNDDKASIVGITEDDRTILLSLSKEASGLDEDEFTLEETYIELPNQHNAYKLLIDPEQQMLYSVLNNGVINVFNISDPEKVIQLSSVKVTNDEQNISRIRFLTGGISLLIGLDDGSVSQWFPVRSETGLTLTRIRDFHSQNAGIADIITEQRRKGFVAISNEGDLALFHSTANREVLQTKITDKPVQLLGLSPRADVLLAQSENTIHVWHIENEHPEISWAVLWSKIWYESYDEPEFIWQSSSASNDFEPKYSLMPLAFGTLKAAFYAMMFAVPLALLGAIYTAYFMAPRMRAVVKPTIEIMEALPTVILGFLAGLWLAPFLEANLPGVFSMLIIVPLGVLLFAFGWHNLPKRYRHAIPDGWQAALLIPVLLFLGWVSFSLSEYMEIWWFGGHMPQWLTDHDMQFDPRNSIVVGIAMGVAVIPTIFSIAEDAVFSVPKSLTFGSLALGATPWQTMVRVVILTASPGIFSAIMIGLGRAVGETMIVLMATGNTPVMDLSIFQGMRTLSANVAVEMPESELHSTHYRILFLAALVLFLFTFVFNTVAELVRQRLRKKYSSL